MKDAECASGKLKDLRTLPISLRRVGSCARIALMHTGSPW